MRSGSGLYDRLEMITLISSLITAYSILIIASAILSWVRHADPPAFLLKLDEIIGVIVNPYLDMIRKILPPIGGVDLSPLVGLIALQIAGRLLIAAIA